ncbi:hypothetical protein AB0M43_27295 [Longispora sp. NPDC051575]
MSRHAFVDGPCGADEHDWQDRADTVDAALDARVALWDGIHAAIQSR